MKKNFDKDTGFTIKTTNNKLIIEMPLSNLVRGFESSPDNYDGGDDTPPCKIGRGHRKEFLHWIAGSLFDECDQDTGQNFLDKMLSDLFMRVYEGYEDFAVYSEELDDI
jgi:hypothetical protein